MIIGVPENAIVIWFIVLNTIFAIAAGKIGESKGYSYNLCALFGLFFGLVAVIVMYMMPEKSIPAETGTDK